MDNLFVKYYGEYSLRYWIRLLLKSDIVLPDFQRPFVWEKEQVISFIHSIDDKQFVPPVIIGNYIDENHNNSNWILDGQQRLCSLLFAYVGMYPKLDEFKYNSGVVSESEEEGETSGADEQISSNYVLQYIQSLMNNGEISNRSEL